MRLVLHVASATKEEITRGLAAAYGVFKRYGVDPRDAADGRSEREIWEHRGYDESAKPSNNLLSAARVMEEAEQAAFGTCCIGWPRAKIGRRALEVRLRETSLADQVAREVKWWADTASGPQMWDVIQHGGLEAKIFLVDGWPQPTVDLGNGRGPLSDFARLSTCDLAKLAWVSGAPTGAVGDAVLQSWFANPDVPVVYAWRHLDEQVTQRGDLFKAIADEWERGIGDSSNFPNLD